MKMGSTGFLVSVCVCERGNSTCPVTAAQSEPAFVSHTLFSPVLIFRNERVCACGTLSAVSERCIIPLYVPDVSLALIRALLMGRLIIDAGEQQMLVLKV